MARALNRPRALLALALLAGGCATPGATRLGEGVEGFEDLSPTGAGAEAADLTVVPLDREGVRGGEVVFSIVGRPEAVRDLLLDFRDAGAHRSWPATTEAVSREGDTILTRWTFAGKMGMNPTVVLAFTPTEHDGAWRIEYRVRETDFGIAAFFGDYQVVTHPLREDWSLVRERVFIDSGLPFANATAEDIAAGLREDVRLLRAWNHASGAR